MKLIYVAILSGLSVASGYSTAGASRREILSSVAKSAAFGLGAASFVSVSDAQALEMCPPKANNCVRTTWTPPSGTSNSDIAAALRDAIQAYPQEGQGDVDGGGWTIASDDLSGSGSARVEFKSSGKGTFAKIFNGGKPFVDDLKLEINDGKVEVKSQSRVGDSDFGVNKKRVDYLAALLSAKGWSV
jgi:hypothetical protein